MAAAGRCRNGCDGPHPGLTLNDPVPTTPLTGKAPPAASPYDQDREGMEHPIGSWAGAGAVPDKQTAESGEEATAPNAAYAKARDAAPAAVPIVTSRTEAPQSRNGPEARFITTTVVLKYCTACGRSSSIYEKCTACTKKCRACRSARVNPLSKYCQGCGAKAPTPALLKSDLAKWVTANVGALVFLAYMVAVMTWVMATITRRTMGIAHGYTAAEPIAERTIEQVMSDLQRIMESMLP